MFDDYKDIIIELTLLGEKVENTPISRWNISAPCLKPSTIGRVMHICRIVGPGMVVRAQKRNNALQKHSYIYVIRRPLRHEADFCGRGHR